jgi:hypothetical protein
MAKIVIAMDIDDELADPGDKTGVTEAGYDAIIDRLSDLGQDIDVKAAANSLEW